MAEKRSQIAKDILRRVRWLYVVFLLIATAIVARVLWIQYGPDGDELRAQARKITFERVAMEAERGDILSADGRILATSIPTYEIRMDFGAAGLADSVFNRYADSLATCLASFFKDKSKASYKKMLSAAHADKKNNRYKLISPRRVNYLEEKEICRFPIFRLGANRGGYIKVKVNKRLLPHGSLAERTIGMTNQSGVRLGVEGAFDEQLRGADGSTLMQRVSGTFRVPVADPLNLEPVNGMDVVTTLDIDLQDVAEKALREQLELGNADWGTVVLMEVATGDIHAMANITRKAPEVYREDFNYAIGRRMEPGSTFKLASLITLLEDAGMSLDKEIDCEGGRARVGRRMVVDDHKEGVLSLRRVFEVSSNIGFAKSVNEAYGNDPARYVDFIDGLGMNKPLGMQIPGEQLPLIKYPGKPGWDGTSLVMMSYGYALEITPMHTLMLYNAVANGGKMMHPRLVKEIQSYGQTVRSFEPEVVNPAICSEHTLKLVRECLQGVTQEGTGSRLHNPWYEVAAKTGTAQMPFDNGGYMDSRGGRNYLATLVGYYPSDNPKYSCIVAIKTYHGPGRRGTYYGASLSLPVFKAIADRVYARNSQWHHFAADGSDDTRRPVAGEIKNGRSDYLRLVADKLSVPLDIDRHSGEWVAVEPPDTAAGAADSHLQTAEIDDDGQTVPSVIGMGLRDALFLLESRGMTVAFSGKGKVVSQSISAGSPAVRGGIIQIRLKN